MRTSPSPELYPALLPYLTASANFYPRLAILPLIWEQNSQLDCEVRPFIPELLPTTFHPTQLQVKVRACS